MGKRHRTDLFEIDGLFAGIKKFFGGEKGSDIDDYRLYSEPQEEGEMTPREWEAHLQLLALTYKPEDGI